MSDSIIRKIAVIFVTDVVGFSKMMEANEDKTLQSFRACMDIMETLFGEHGGRVFNTAGDSVLAEFQSAVSAVVCASEFQKLVEQRNSSIDSESRMMFRVGINMGDVIVEGDNLYGDGVNVAARLEALSQIPTNLTQMRLRPSELRPARAWRTPRSLEPDPNQSDPSETSPFGTAPCACLLHS